MPKTMRMNVIEATRLCGSIYQIINSKPAQPTLAFRHEQPRQAIVSSGEISTNCPKLVSLDRMHPCIPSLEPPDPQRSSTKAHILSPQIEVVPFSGTAWLPVSGGFCACLPT